MCDMFNIYSIYAGWMTVSFGERKDEGYAFTDKNGEVFHFSCVRSLFYNIYR